MQNAIDPIPVAGAEGRHFWDYDGKRYLDFASQLVNVSIGYGHPKLIAAIKEQAEKLARSARRWRRSHAHSSGDCWPRSRPGT